MDKNKQMKIIGYVLIGVGVLAFLIWKSYVSLMLGIVVAKLIKFYRVDSERKVAVKNELSIGVLWLIVTILLKLIL